MCLLVRPDHPRRELTKSGTIPPVPKKNLLLTFPPWATCLGRFASVWAYPSEQQKERLKPCPLGLKSTNGHPSMRTPMQRTDGGP